MIDDDDDDDDDGGDGDDDDIHHDHNWQTHNDYKSETDTQQSA